MERPPVMSPLNQARVRNTALVPDDDDDDDYNVGRIPGELAEVAERVGDVVGEGLRKRVKAVQKKVLKHPTFKKGLHWAAGTQNDTNSGRGALFAFLEQRRQNASLMLNVTSLFGLVVALIHYYLVTDPLQFIQSWHEEILKWLVFALWGAAVICWYRYYSIVARLHALTCFQDKDVKTEEFHRRIAMTAVTPLGWYRAGVVGDAIADFVILLPQPLPFLNFSVKIYEHKLHRYDVYGLDELMLFFMFARIAFIPRWVFEFSRLKSFNARAIGNLNFCTIDQSLIIRSLLGGSLLAVVSLYAILIVMFSFMMLVAERPNKSSILHHSLTNCGWLIIITMTTVGYGDVYPMTKLGRIVAIFAAFCAVVSTALFVNLATTHLGLSHSEAKLIEVVDRIDRSKELQVAAARCAQTTFRAYKKRVNKTYSKAGAKDALLGMTNTSITFDRAVVRAVREFRACRVAYLSDCIDNDQATMMSKVESSLAADIVEIGENLQSLAARVREMENAVFEQLDALHQRIRSRM